VKADMEDQLVPVSNKKRYPVVNLVIAALLLVGLLVVWLWVGRSDPLESSSSGPPVVSPAPQPATPVSPDIPLRPEPITEAESGPMDTDSQLVGSEPPPPLPTEQEVDELLHTQLTVIGADANIKKLVGNQRPLELSAVLLDGLSQGVILRKKLSVGPPKQAFSVVQDGDAIYMNEDNYERYDSFANSIASLDSSSVVDSFHMLRPFYEQVYEKLSLDPGDFDNAIIRTLDLILATPEIEGPIELQREKVMYTYLDPTLESLPELQKQLLRMGPDNIGRIKEQAQIIRKGLLAQ
jgi:hypothetical protein